VANVRNSLASFAEFLRNAVVDDNGAGSIHGLGFLLGCCYEEIITKRETFVNYFFVFLVFLLPILLE
jgi:hypothetical protein